jgi:hypothetical protein
MRQTCSPAAEAQDQGGGIDGGAAGQADPYADRTELVLKPSTQASVKPISQ